MKEQLSAVINVIFLTLGIYHAYAKMVKAISMAATIIFIQIIIFRSSTVGVGDVARKRVNRLVIGFAALLASAAIGTTGIAAAHQMDHKPSKSQCAAAGFSNYGQCVREWAHNKAGQNNQNGGYGGTTTVNANVDLELNNSNGNVITVILNFFRP